MIIAFVIWSAVCLFLFGIGLWARAAREPVGFYAGVKPPEVRDTRKYNRAVAFLWFGYAFLMELLGLPLLFLEQNSAFFLFPVLGAVFCSLLLLPVYEGILKRHKK